MKRLPALLATFLAAVVGLTAFAWVRAGQDRYAGLQAEALALARLLKSTALDAAKTLESAESALGARLTAAARRADVEVEHARRPARDVLRDVAREERVGRIFLLDAAGKVVASARSPEPLEGSAAGMLPMDQAAILEAEEAERAVRALTPGPRGALLEGFRPNAFGTRERFGVAYGRAGGGTLLLRAEADELERLRQEFGIDAALHHVRSVHGVELADLLQDERVSRHLSDGESESVRVFEDSVRSLDAAVRISGHAAGPAAVIVRLSLYEADRAVERTREVILTAGLLAALIAVGAALLLRARGRKSDREKAELAERREEDRRLAEAGALASLFAHEISNPLNSIRLGLRLLDGKGSAEEAESVLATVRSESGRMAASLEGFLALAQGRGTGRDVVDPSLLDDVARNVEAQADRRRVSLDRRVAGDAPTATGSRTVLEQALTSLVRNAIEASPEGSSVKVRWMRGEDGGALVTVEDHGPGFPPGDRSELLRLGRSRREGGHGLGLPLAERFVAAHGGTLTLADADGGGARVEVRLPAAQGKMPT